HCTAARRIHASNCSGKKRARKLPVFKQRTIASTRSSSSSGHVIVRHGFVVGDDGFRSFASVHTLIAPSRSVSVGGGIVATPPRSAPKRVSARSRNGRPSSPRVGRSYDTLIGAQMPPDACTERNDCDRALTTSRIFFSFAFALSVSVRASPYIACGVFHPRRASFICIPW